MTNDPRYSPPPQQPGYRPAPNQAAPVPGQTGTPAYAQGRQQPYSQQFDWRRQPPQPAQYRPPFEPYSGTEPGRIPRGTGPGPIPGMLP
ncbi:MAG TPA: peptidase S1, partial [Mycobacterium sp.]|nr:peptidase S1 [Mycobacterium sp.]